MTGIGSARLTLHPTAARRALPEPLTVGLAVPRGLWRDADGVHIRDAAGHGRPVQTAVLERWSDGSARWLLFDFQAAVDAPVPLDVTVAAAPAPAHPSPARAVAEGQDVRLTTGPLSLLVGPGRILFHEATRDGRPLLDPAGTGLFVRLAGAADAPVTIDAAEIETAGPLRAAVRLTGRVDGTELRASCRIEVFAGLPHVRLRWTLHNPRPARHPGGFWELGDAGSILLEEVAVRVAPALDPAVAAACSLDRGLAAEPCALPLRVHQESSGRANWQSPVHVDRTGVVAPRYAGCRLTAGTATHEAATATPILHVAGSGGGLSVASRLFWEVFPKAYGVAPDGVVTLSVLPADRAADHELQGGERISHDFVLSFDGDPLALDWVRSPALAVVDPVWWAATHDIAHLSPARSADHPYERLVNAAIEGPDTFAAKRDRIDEYGWRHYGDLYADHENGVTPGAMIVSHYNNQYDGIAGLLIQFARSGNPRWWPLADDLARHVRDIDIYWTDEDKSAYSGGLFWHTYHYVDAGKATHRCYPNAAGVPGGGPSVEHNYSTGLLLHYFMTGDPDSREAVLRLARWTRDMDDGGRTVFRFLSRGATGLASATGAVDYHGPGRGPANAVHTLLNALRLTGDRSWLDAAEVLIRRCAHPHDDLEALNLLDAERRWYYTVFLQALGRYLAVKSERGEEDAAWHYARATLLHYATWMAAHEYPYLQKPEILEYPTETWAAQDMRKCEVFDLAAEYAADATARARFVERARYFFGQSVSTLHAWPTRTWTRPVVLMLSYGYAHLWHEQHRDALPLLPPSAGDFGRPARFEPQRVVAVRRAKWLVAAAGVAALAGLAALVAWLV